LDVPAQGIVDQSGWMSRTSPSGHPAGLGKGIRRAELRNSGPFTPRRAARRNRNIGFFCSVSGNVHRLFGSRQSVVGGGCRRMHRVCRVGVQRLTLLARLPLPVAARMALAPWIGGSLRSRQRPPGRARPAASAPRPVGLGGRGWPGPLFPATRTPPAPVPLLAPFVVADRWWRLAPFVVRGGRVRGPGK
jgi:hypothetical protein